MSKGIISGDGENGLYDVTIEMLDGSPFVSPAWCVDRTEDLSGAVGIIEIAGALDKGFNIQPGHENNAAYNAARDGSLKQVQPFPNTSPTGEVYWNWAMRSGWQKWKPNYRYGVISNINMDSDTCNVALDDCYATDAPDGQLLDINQASSLTGVEIDYMDCNATAFKDGARVIVKFENNDWESPKVIGFESEPQPCVEPGQYYVFFVGRWPGSHFLIWDGILNQEAVLEDNFPSSGSLDAHFGGATQGYLAIRRYMADTPELEEEPDRDVNTLYTVIDDDRDSQIPITDGFQDSTVQQVWWNGYSAVTQFESVCPNDPDVPEDPDHSNDRPYDIEKDSAYKVYNAPFNGQSDQDIMRGHNIGLCDVMGDLWKATWDAYFFVAYGNSFQSGWNTFSGFTRYGIFQRAQLVVPNAGPSLETQYSIRSSHEETSSGWQIVNEDIEGAYPDDARWYKRDTEFRFFIPPGEMEDWKIAYSEYDANDALTSYGISPGETALMSDGKNIRINPSYFTARDSGGYDAMIYARFDEVSDTQFNMFQIYVFLRMQRTSTWIDGVGPEYSYERIVKLWAGMDVTEYSVDGPYPNPITQGRNNALEAAILSQINAANNALTDETEFVDYLHLYTFVQKQPETTMFELINNHRVSMGVSMVRWSPCILASIATEHSQNIEDQTIACGHTGWAARQTKIHGYYGTYLVLGEVVACDWATEAEAFQAWLDSPEHRAIIENVDVDHVGYGRVGDNYTAIFMGYLAEVI